MIINMKILFNFYVEKENKESLLAIAKEKNVSAASIINNLIKDYVRSIELKPKKEERDPFAPYVDTLEDIEAERKFLANEEDFNKRHNIK